MKPYLSVFTHIYVLMAKIVDLILSILVVAKNQQPAFTVHHPKAHPSRLVLVTFVLGVLSWSVAGQTHGTSIMIIKTGDEITVAADSRVVTSQETVLPIVECKIRRFGDAYVTSNGLSTSPTGFNAFGVLNQASRAKGGILSKIAKFEQLSKPQLAGAFEIESTHEFQATFFGFLKGGAFFISRKAIIKSLVNEPIVVDFERFTCPGACKTWYYVPAESVPRFLATNPSRGNPENATIVRAFVQMNIDIKMPKVGPPIDVLRITKDGACWVGPKTNKDCDDPKIEACEVKSAPGLPAKLTRKTT